MFVDIDRIAYNKFETIPNFGYNILTYLMLNNENIWKLLKYNTPDALDMPNVTLEEKRSMIYNGNGDSENYNIFRCPFLDDAFTKQTSQLRIYEATILPNNRSIATNDISIECITHVKLVNLDNYQSRAERLLAEVLGTLNGQDIDGVGVLFFDAKESMYNNARANIFNNRYFFGYTITMSVKNGDIGVGYGNK